MTLTDRIEKRIHRVFPELKKVLTSPLIRHIALEAADEVMWPTEEEKVS